MTALKGRRERSDIPYRGRGEKTVGVIRISCEESHWGGQESHKGAT